jgi:hypothetical protein
MDVDLALEAVANSSQLPATPFRRHGIPTPIPRSKRQPFYPTGNRDNTPKPVNGSAPPSSVEPLSIKKKTSVRATMTTTSTGSPTPARKAYTRNSPLSRTSARIVSPKRTSPQVRSTRMMQSTHHSPKHESTERIMQLAQTTKEDVRFSLGFPRKCSLIKYQVESSCRAVKRIKLEINYLHPSNLQGSEDEQSRPPSPDKGARTPQRTTPAMVRYLLFGHATANLTILSED